MVAKLQAKLKDYIDIIQKVARVEYKRIPSHMLDCEELVSIGICGCSNVNMCAVSLCKSRIVIISLDMDYLPFYDARKPERQAGNHRSDIFGFNVFGRVCCNRN